MPSKVHARLRVLQAITAHLEGITQPNGYQHDLTGRVYRGRDLFGTNDKPPFIAIIEAKSSDIGNFADENKTIRSDQFVVLVQGFAEDDKLNPTDGAYQLLMDVEARLSDIIATKPDGTAEYPGVYNLRGLITSMAIASPVVRPPENGVSSTAYFYLPLRIGMAVNIKKPWLGSKEINQ